jgi:hypothetical protein
VAKDALDHFVLVALDEAGDFHLAATVRALQWIDFEDALDQAGQRGRANGDTQLSFVAPQLKRCPLRVPLRVFVVKKSLEWPKIATSNPPRAC